MSLITIILPTYNNAHSIIESIKSVQEQTLDTWELVIVDDGSTDHTYKKIQEVLQDDRISYYRQENKGVCAARNFGAEKANGEYLLFLDADDKLYEDSLHNFIDIIEKENNLGICSASFFDQKLNKTVFPEKAGSIFLNHKVNILCGSCIVSKNVFEMAGKYDENIAHSENWELFIRLTRICEKQKFKILSINSKSFNYNNLYSSIKIEKKISDKYVTYKYLFEKYAEKNILSNKIVANFAEIVALNAFKIDSKNINESIKWQLKALRKHPFKFISYLRALRYFYYNLPGRTR